MPRFTPSASDSPAVSSWAELIADELGLTDAQLTGQRQKILTVARAWTELSRTMPRHLAVETLRKGLGTVYDPACVGALIWSLAKLNPPSRGNGGVRRPGL